MRWIQDFREGPIAAGSGALHASGRRLSVACLAAACLAAALIALPALPAMAQSSSTSMPGLAISNDQPIQIESDKLEIKEAEKKAVFTGNVKVSQGDTLLQSGAMTVFYKGGTGGAMSSGGADIDRIEVSDKVLLKTETQTASADRGHFDMAREIAVLEGEKVVLTQGDNIFIGCRMTVNMRSSEARLESCGGRVRIQLDPKSRPQQ
ncbi:LptA/OstA family protein [Pseudohoeflea coraliihabitans]|uniref:LptA/OstA family protein n=1 Tax=Pseudohoeflea coraliihabitans TaxID=2860393 RepID=A0ABS6WNQ4_9HYPH|nr:LptA/OstA family protein [Pseudohoeflea sp. DP4N28-3]MBW3097592.1 LptA/OstA family protein [Pseudohoeflea sp. DP4N28-3]